MIGWEDVYKVVVAMVPLYFALILGFGSVRWWGIFTPEQCGAINRFVCFFTLPLFTFEFTAHVDPFEWNYRFIAADAISKLIIVVVLAFWAKCSSKGSYSWSITSFSLCTLTNSLVVGVPLMKAMYGPMAVDLVVQSSVVQAIIWLTVLLFVLEFRRTGLDISSNDTRVQSVELQGVKDVEGLNQSTVANSPSYYYWSLLKGVWLKLGMNPNSYAVFIGIAWAFIANRWHIELPSIMEGSVLIMSKAGTGTAMFSMGIFMALQEKFVACGTSLTIIGMVLRFIAGPAAMAIGCIAVGLHGDVLRVAIIQAALPQSITSFIFAKEYGLHADVLSTAGSIMDEPYDSRVFNWCEVKQTELHEGPYPPPSQRYAVLIRITVTLQSAGFQIQTKPPHSFMYNFCPEVTLIGKSKIWVNFMSADERGKSIMYLVTALRRMGLRLKELADIVKEISDKVEPPIHLPQLAVDVTIRLMCCELHGSFDGYDDKRLYRWVKKSWDDSRVAAPTSCAMPPSSCAVCLEEFGGGVDDKMIARLPCSHYFHADCIAQWVVDRHTCPVCRTQMIPLLCDDENQPFDPNPTWSE